MMASNFCYATAPGSECGELHTMRQGIISNKVLQAGAARVGLPSYIQHKRFVAKLWHPPLLAEAATTSTKDTDGDVRMADPPPSNGEESKDKGKRSKKQRQLDELNTLWMGDKVSALLSAPRSHPTPPAYHSSRQIVADVVEAILAAAFLSGGHEGALQAARRLSIPIPNVAQWSDYARLASEHASRLEGKGKGVATAPSIVARSVVERLENMLGATFSQPELLGQALVGFTPRQTCTD